ncbi:unnamed protein product [Ectocarpus sp. CCAP 1310/34]|nr:unnamed protein product [Ectocarpus sp. CCAP 1310/34]
MVVTLQTELECKVAPSSTHATQKPGYTFCCRPDSSRRDATCLVRTVKCAAINKQNAASLHGPVFKGGCGGRLHSNCGSMFEDDEKHLICSKCVDKAGKRKATPAGAAGAGPSI